MEETPRETGASLIKAETRRRIIEVLVGELSYRRLAEAIGVTPAAVHKYVAGKSTPGDEVIVRAVELAGELGLREVGEIILEDLAVELEALLKTLTDLGMASPQGVSRLSDVVGRVKLAVAAGLNGGRTPRIPR